MQKDVKTGLFLGLVLAAGAGLWLATRPQLTASSRLRNMESERGFSDEEPRFVTSLPQANSADEAGDDDVPAANMETRRFHIVRRGETLSAIAQRYYGTTTAIEKLRKANTITNPDKIAPGTKLVIPN
jgi:nucleoid-associated protein YgaU